MRVAKGLAHVNEAMRVGVFVVLDDHVEAALERLRVHGFTTCQLCAWDERFMTEDYARRALDAAAASEVEITAFWCGWRGPAVWNFYDGPRTLGLVPAEYRADRVSTLKHGSDFARLLGVENIITHVGFLPEDPNTPLYVEVVEAIREVAEHCRANGQYFLFETGQETPVTLRRTIEDVGTGNLGINLDPANLILYGKGDPVAALGLLGPYVRGVHGKDGCYPTDGRHLGQETPLGEGMVDYPALLRRLRACGYDGAITIEREISGDAQTADILRAKAYLTRLFEEAEAEEPVRSSD